MKKYQMFEWNPKPSMEKPWLEIGGPDGQITYPPGMLKTRKGTIIFFEAYNDRTRAYGVVPGWVVSKPRKAPGRDTLLVRVVPLTPAEKRRYRDRLCKIICARKIFFW